MRIIQPAISNVCLDKKDRIILEDTILIMLEHGIRMTNELSPMNVPGTVLIFKPKYTPEFEKLFIYGDTIPQHFINERTSLHITQHYEYMKNIFELRVKGEDYLCKRVVLVEAKASVGKSSDNEYETIYARKKRVSLDKVESKLVIVRKKQLRFGQFCVFIQTNSQRSEHAWYD